MPHAVTHKDTQPIASHQAGKTRSLPLQSAGDGALRTSTVPVGGEDAQRLARTLVHAHVQRHPIHVQRADGVVDDETDVVRMPASRPMFMTWIGNGVLDGFLEDESLFGEFLRTPVSEGAVRHYESGIRV